MNKIIYALQCVACVAFATALPRASARADETVLHSFTGTPDGTQPQAGLTSDPAGNLYGATPSGGQNNAGMVYQLQPDGKGGWTYNEIYSVGGDDDQAFPQGRVAVGPDGHLYVTTALDSNVGNGGVFELVPGTNGTWQLGRHVLFDGLNGAKPQCGVVVDAEGNLYGDSRIGGVGNGTVFEVVPAGANWKIKALHKFNGGSDGANPKTELFLGPNGDLYGTDESGDGSGGYVYKLHQGAHGWKFSTIYTFKHGEGQYNATGALVRDQTGNLYGTEDLAIPVWGHVDYQAVFKLTPPKKGTQWTQTRILRLPIAHAGLQGVILDQAGNAYTGAGAGGHGGWGRILELTPTISGGWTKTVLYTFHGGADGAYPADQLLIGPGNQLFGVAGGGGNGAGLAGDGVVFSVTQ